MGSQNHTLIFAITQRTTQMQESSFAWMNDTIDLTKLNSLDIIVPYVQYIPYFHFGM